MSNRGRERKREEEVEYERQPTKREKIQHIERKEPDMLECREREREDVYVCVREVGKVCVCVCVNETVREDMNTNVPERDIKAWRERE